MGKLHIWPGIKYCAKGIAKTTGSNQAENSWG
jgi:hypothetical protein